jgi:hypothetical protein
LAEHCRVLHLPFLDTAGNAYLDAPGLTIYVTGEPRPDIARDDPRYRAYTTVGMKVVFALLCWPELAEATHRNLAAAAQVALGTVGPVIEDLESGQTSRYNLQAGFTSLWLPPAAKAEQGNSEAALGYSVFDGFNLGSKNQKGTVHTRYGDREQLARYVAILRANGLEVFEWAFPKLMKRTSLLLPVELCCYSSSMRTLSGRGFF